MSRHVPSVCARSAPGTERSGSVEVELDRTRSSSRASHVSRLRCRSRGGKTHAAPTLGPLSSPTRAQMTLSVGHARDVNVLARGEATSERERERQRGYFSGGGWGGSRGARGKTCSGSHRELSGRWRSMRRLPPRQGGHTDRAIDRGVRWGGRRGQLPRELRSLCYRGCKKTPRSAGQNS